MVARGAGVRSQATSAEPVRVRENRMENPGTEGVCGKLCKNTAQNALHIYLVQAHRLASPLCIWWV